MSSTVITDGVYSVKNVSTGTFLDLYDGLTTEGNPIQGFQGHGGDNQKWRVKYTGTGHNVTLQNVKSGTYASYGAAENSSRVVGSKTPKNFNLIASNTGYAYAIPWFIWLVKLIIPVSIALAENHHYVCDLKESDPTNETPVIVYNDNVTDNQLWIFTRA
ncbi:unnamed protein product [Rhizoctonia solani]|uniref:Ricin B lectin domain-containing protein n=1 Tax=Rhizoctonia solani TaxID=456999 RepID=A0A8H3HTP3_9AGAM|nr:unnamed protein product [Rhizoctonia solani]